MEYIVGIEKAFKEYIGSDSINKLRENITDKPMILIAGDQLTGKSTQAKNLAEHYSGTFYSVGNLFREVAAKRGITVAEQAKLLLTERGIDVEIDYKTCEMISGKNIDTNLAVIEGRQPAYMGNFMQELGKRHLVRIYFQCSIREQALRFLRREIGEAAYQKGLANVPDVNYNTLESLQDEIFNLELPDSNEVIQKFVDNQNRDEDDRDRYSSLYGFDYGNLSGYDIVVNTTNKEADSVFEEVVSELENIGFRTN